MTPECTETEEKMTPEVFPDWEIVKVVSLGSKTNFRFIYSNDNTAPVIMNFPNYDEGLRYLEALNHPILQKLGLVPIGY